MSERDVKLLRDGFSRLAEEGYESLLPLLHPEFEMTTLPEIAAEPQTYRGTEGMRRWWESFYEVMDEVQVVPNEFHDAGEGRVVIAATLRAKGQSSRLEVEQPAFLRVHLRDGRMYGSSSSGHKTKLSRPRGPRAAGSPPPRPVHRGAESASPRPARGR